MLVFVILQYVTKQRYELVFFFHFTRKISHKLCVLFRDVWHVIKHGHCQKESIITGFQQNKNTY